MKVHMICNEGGGFADTILIERGITVGRLFSLQLPGRDPRDYLIRVNRQPCSSEQVIEDGDRVSITPTKIEGAA